MKDALKETKTVEIEILHERVTIERKPFNCNNKILNSKTNSGLDNAVLYEKEMNKETDIQ